MRMLPLLLAGGCFLIEAPTASADDGSAAKAIIDTAIKGHGGADQLAKTALVTRQAKGIMSLFGQEVAFTDELVLQLPQRFRWTLDTVSGGQKTRLVLVVNGQKGSQAVAGNVTDLGKDRLAELHEESYVIWLSFLVPFLADHAFSMTVIPATVVDGRPADGVLVTQKGRPDVRLYFDKQSGLLVKMARRATEAGLAVEKEYLYSAHKSFDGVQLPTKYVELTNGRKFVEVTDMSYKFIRTMSDNTFTRP